MDKRLARAFSAVVAALIMATALLVPLAAFLGIVKLIAWMVGA